MGEHGSWAKPSGLLPNGLLPNEVASVTRVLDADRWSIAEQRTVELIACIQPNLQSEKRRKDVANYVRQLIMKCFSCEVFTFGSVPLKTYLPDGDIDLTAFSPADDSLKDTWANAVRDMLEKEEKSESAEFRVKEVQYIQAEVKIVKCLVENIVVDISFNQLGGLCTLCFLDERFSTTVEEKAKWIFEKLKGKPSKSLPELLREYGLPQGLFPRNIICYEFDEVSSKLVVHLASPCEVSFKDSSVLRYATRVKGVLSRGKLSGVEGMKTKVVVWVKVTQVGVESHKSDKVWFMAGVKKLRPKDAYEMQRDSVKVDEF